MANSMWITQYPVRVLETNIDNINLANIDENDLFNLLENHWKSLRPPSKVNETLWRYDFSHGEINLWNNSTVSFRHVVIADWILITLMLRDFLKRPIYIWNDSNPDNFLEITADTKEQHILLWLKGL